MDDIDAEELNGGSVLYTAIVSNNVEAVNQLLAWGFDLEKKDENGYNALHLAILKGNSDIIKLILSKGVDYNKTTSGPCRQTPLHLAISSNNLEIVKFLINNNVVIDRQDTSGDTPLHYAVDSESMSIVLLLLKQGADPNIMNDPQKDNLLREHYRNSPFHNALKKRSDSMHHLFLNFDVHLRLPNGHGEHALHLAAEYSTATVVKRLLKMNVDVNVRSNSNAVPLHYAAKNFRRIEALRIVKLLIKYGGNINLTDKHNHTPFIFAIRKGQYEITKYLINLKNFRRSAYGNNDPLYHAIDAQVKSCDIVVLLLKHGFRINHLKHGLLAATAGDCRIMKLLLNNGLDVNAADPIDELSILTTAIYSNNWNMVQLMLDNGADINYEKNGWVPLKAIWEEFYRCPIVRKIVKHIVLMLYKEERVHELHLRMIKDNIELKLTFDRYYKELSVLDETAVWGGLPSITYLDLLISRSSALVKLLRCEEIKSSFLSGHYKTICHEYLEPLELNVRTGIHRLDAIVKGEEELHKIFGKILPLEITNHIAEYLDVVDLHTIVK